MTADRAMAAFRRLPIDALPSSGVSFVLFALCSECDRDFSCNDTEEDLAALTRAGVSTVRKHMAWLAAEHWIARERTRNADGSFGPYRTFLGLEKLGHPEDHRSNRAVAAAVGNPVDDPAQPPLDLSSATAQIEQPPLKSSGPLRKYFLPSSFHFQDEDSRMMITRILDACGPGLVAGDVSDRPLVSLARRLPGWLKLWDLEADILPVVIRKTRRRRQNPLMDLNVLESDIVEHRAERMRALRLAAADPAAERRTAQRAADLARREEIAELTEDLARYDRGEWPAPPGFDPEAWDTVMDRSRRKLAELEAMEPAQ